MNNQNSRFESLQARVIQWANDKGIMEKATPEAQASKTVEEANELFDACWKNDKEAINDGIGDVLTTIIIQAEMQGVDILNCLEDVLGIIEKRTGKMSNGVFVKDK